MDITDILEHSMPIIQADTKKIKIISSRNFEGSFILKNIGGSRLEGKITSNLRGLEFFPMDFSGNRVKISYRFDLNFYKKGDTIETSALIMSNGGEIIIPVIIKIVPPSIFSIDGEEINSLEDFVYFSRKQPIEARRLFVQKEFLAWLKNMGYPNIQMYSHFVADLNVHRGLDNFLVFSKLKNPAVVKVATNNIKMKFKYTDKEPVTNVIPLKLEGWGYVDYKVEFSPISTCIKILTEKINIEDFDDNGFSEITFIAYPSQLKSRYICEKIKLIGDNDTEINIELTKEKVYTVVPSKQSYGYEDSGSIIVNNKSGQDIMLDIYAKDNFVKFEGQRYMVGNKAEIGFKIKMTPFQSAQYIIKKQPVIKSEVVIKTSIDNKIIYRKIVLFIGKIV